MLVCSKLSFQVIGLVRFISSFVFLYLAWNYHLEILNVTAAYCIYVCNVPIKITFSLLYFTVIFHAKLNLLVVLNHLQGNL